MSRLVHYHRIIDGMYRDIERLNPGMLLTPHRPPLVAPETGFE